MLVVLWLLGCGSSSPTLKVQISLSHRTVSATSPSRPGIGPYSAPMGQAIANGILDFGYALREVKLCKNLQISGTGYSNPNGCLTIVEKPDVGAFTYDPSKDFSTALASSAKASPSQLPNLFDDNQRPTITTNTVLNSSAQGTYSYGVYSWYPILRVQADIPVGSDFFHTLGGTTASFITTSPASFITAAASGGAFVATSSYSDYFTLQTPIRLTSGILGKKDTWVTELLFAPDASMKAYNSQITCPKCPLKDTSGNQIAVFPPPFVAAFRNDSDRLIKQTYSTTVSSTDIFDLRIEAFFLKSNPAILYALDAHTLVNASGTGVVMEFPRIASMSQSSDGSYQLLNADGTAAVSGFFLGTRKGDSHNATLQCSSTGTAPFYYRGCGSQASDPASSSITFTLTDIEELLPN